MPGTLLFITMSLGLLLVPGPTNTLLAVGGAATGLRRSWVLMPAALCGYLCAIHVLAFIAGPFVQGSPAVQLTLRIVLALYLLWLGVALWRSEVTALPTQAVTPGRVFLVTLLNPKALVFAFVVLPPLSEGRWMETTPWLAGLSVMIAISSLAWISLGAAIAGGRMLRPYARLIPRAGSVVLAAFAVVIVATAKL